MVRPKPTLDLDMPPVPGAMALSTCGVKERCMDGEAREVKVAGVRVGIFVGKAADHEETSNCGLMGWEVIREAGARWVTLK